MSDSSRPGRLDGKIALVTGAAEGIGEAIAHKFAYEGAAGLLLAGLPDDPLDQVAADITDQYGTEVGTFAGDLGDPDKAQACVQAAVDAFGRLDVLVNNAGALPKLAPVDEYPIDDFDKLIHNNVKTAFFMTRAAVPHLRETRGNVVSAGSEAGWNGSPQFTPYGPTKAWIHAFMKGVAGEQGPNGVRANCVCPGPIDTSWTHKETGPMDADAEETVVMSTAFGRRGDDRGGRQRLRVPRVRRGQLRHRRALARRRRDDHRPRDAGQARRPGRADPAARRAPAPLPAERRATSERGPVEPS